MKNFIYLSIIGFLLTSCGGGSDDPATPEEVNVAPSIPALTAPSDNKLCVDNTVSFQWNLSTDANKDVITYQIQVAKDNAFSQVIKTAEVATNNTSVALDKNTAYYWRLKATDSKGLSSAYSATFKLYTTGEAVVNHLPFAPELVAPALNTQLTGADVILRWSATDVDSDPLIYDLYFGTANPPTTKIIENSTSISYAVLIEASTEYFWKVVVKDNKGGETEGQVWKFKTN